MQWNTGEGRCEIQERGAAISDWSSLLNTANWGDLLFKTVQKVEVIGFFFFLVG